MQAAAGRIVGRMRKRICGNGESSSSVKTMTGMPDRTQGRGQTVCCSAEDSNTFCLRVSSVRVSSV